MIERKPSEEKVSESAEEIAGQGNYNTIVEGLLAAKLLDAEVQKCRAKYESRIAESWLTDKDWEMLTVLGLYDSVTQEHCVHTYEIAKSKVESKNLVGPDDQPVSLLAEIEKEGVTEEQFLRACLLHDIGKVEVPRYIIGNTLGKEQWQALLLDAINSGEGGSILWRIKLDPDISYTPEEIQNAMDAEHVRPIMLVPARLALSEAELSDLERRKISTEQTVMSIINGHERSSLAILSSCGCSIEAEIAGHHHNYTGEKEPYPNSTEVLRESRILGAVGTIVDYLHLMDIHEALTSKDRPYRGPASLIETLAVLVAEQKAGAISKAHAYAWVQDEYKRMDTASIKESDKGYLEIVQAFLRENHHPT